MLNYRKKKSLLTLLRFTGFNLFTKVIPFKYIYIFNLKLSAFVAKKMMFYRFNYYELFIRNYIRFGLFKNNNIISDQKITNRYVKENFKIYNHKNFLKLNKKEIYKKTFHIYSVFDENIVKIIEKIKKNNGKFISEQSSSNTSLRFIKKNIFLAVKKTFNYRKRFSHLDPEVHENICEAIEITKKLSGSYVEIGVFRGGSLHTAINYYRSIKSKKRTFYGLDTFEGFEYEIRTSDIIWKNTHRIYKNKNSISLVNKNLKNHRGFFKLIKNNIIYDKIPNRIKKVAVANIDVDMLDAVEKALEKIAPLVVKNGIIIVEDAAKTPALYGAYYALSNFLKSNNGKKFICIFKKSQYFLIKK